MSNDAKQWNVRGIYTQAVRIEDDAARQTFLHKACGGNGALRRRVEELLAARASDRSNLLRRATSDSKSGQNSWHEDDDDIDEKNLDVQLTQHSWQPRQRVGRFIIRELVGYGGMGVVYQGYDERLDRMVALKFPKIETVGNRTGRERLIREAKLAAQLDHPNLVKIYEVADSGPVFYIASQWCEGGNLAELLRGNPSRQPPKWSAAIIAALARAVAYCHKQRIVHLDIKPPNIMMVPGSDDDDSRSRLIPMLTDFGVARVIEENLTVTESSVMIGTPLYMAPEQAKCQRDQIGPASDIYSLGVILFELLFGRRPHQGESAMEVLDRVRSEESIRLPNEPAVSTDLKTICERCLEHWPESRYPTADALAEDLERYLRGEAIHARPIRWWHRFGRWCRQPARIYQAGLVSVPIQAALLLNFAGVVIGLYQGVFDDSVDPRATSLDIAKVAFGAHFPQLILAWLSFRRVRWTVIPGFMMSLITVCILAEVLITGGSPITFYDDYPAARFLMHLLILVIMTIQTFAYLVAIPAALGRRNPSS